MTRKLLILAVLGSVACGGSGSGGNNPQPGTNHSPIAGLLATNRDPTYYDRNPAELALVRTWIQNGAPDN